MKLNSAFQTASVPIPDRSGFDLSREHLFTAGVGTLVPAECFEVLPNDTISMGAMHKVTLPPFAVPFMGRIDACLEAFFVPSRILWKNFQSFISQNNGVQSTAATGIPTRVPVIDCAAAGNQPYLGAGSLADYLGFYTPTSLVSVQNQPYISAMKFLAYHKIADTWYRDQNNVKPFFVKSVNSSAGFVGSSAFAHVIDSIGMIGTNTAPVVELAPAASPSSYYDAFADWSLGLGSLRQRSWAKDYFTTMTTRPQAGDAAQITFSTSGATGSITISDIRVANALQKWLERNNISGTDYGAQILAHFGVTPPDAIMDKPILLGQLRESVYVGSVENNSNAQQTDPDSDRTANPWGTTLGSAAGMASSFGKGSLIPEFHAKEHGYIMVLFSLVPHAYYDTGVERENFHLSIGDFAWPEYAKIGDQPVYDQELYIGDNHPGDIIGYNQRYSEYKFRIDKISGLLHNGRSLEVYALKRGFSSDPQLGKDFLEIPESYLDQVAQTDVVVSEFGCIVDSYFDTRAIRLLPSYSLPSL